MAHYPKPAGKRPGGKPAPLRRSDELKTKHMKWNKQPDLRQDNARDLHDPWDAIPQRRHYPPQTTSRGGVVQNMLRRGAR